MTTPEGKVKAAITKWLKSIGAYYYMPQSNGRGRVGAPDYIVCNKGEFWGIEAKAPGKLKNTTPNQRRELNWIDEAGGVSLVVEDVAQLRYLLGHTTCRCCGAPIKS